jgi:hypothetical protein
LRQSELPHYPGLHPLIAGLNKPYPEPDWAQLGGIRILLKCDSGMPEWKKIWPHLIDLGVIGIILTINKKEALFPRNHRILVRNHGLSFLPIGVCCMLSGRLQGFIPQKMAHFEEHILTLHTEHAKHFELTVHVAGVVLCWF